MDSENVYDRIDIFIAGSPLTARPIGFEMDEKGDPLIATQYETTCPECGSVLQFSALDVRVSGEDEVLLGCSECGAGADELKVDDQISVARVGEIGEEAGVHVPDQGCPFCDPVELGIFEPTKLVDF